MGTADEVFVARAKCHTLVVHLTPSYRTANLSGAPVVLVRKKE